MRNGIGIDPLADSHSVVTSSSFVNGYQQYLNQGGHEFTMTCKWRFPQETAYSANKTAAGSQPLLCWGYDWLWSQPYGQTGSFGMSFCRMFCWTEQKTWTTYGNLCCFVLYFVFAATLFEGSCTCSTQPISSNSGNSRVWPLIWQFEGRAWW